MTENEDWDIEKYHNKFEPEEQWEMKRKFMTAHKQLFSEERLACLAQVLVNVEFLGTRYPHETMKLVAELGHDIILEFRERQKGRLQRTFVGGSDAAKNKVKGRIAFVKASNTLGNESKDVGESVARKSRESEAGPSKVLVLESKMTVSHKVVIETEEILENPEAIDDLPQVSSKKKKKKKKAKASGHDQESTSSCAVDNSQGKTLKRKLAAGDDEKIARETGTRKEEEKPLASNSGASRPRDPVATKKQKLSDMTTQEVSPSLASKHDRLLSKAANGKAHGKLTSADSNSLHNFVLVICERDLDVPAAVRRIIQDSARLSRIPLQIQSYLQRDKKTWESVLHLGGRPFATLASQGENQKSCERNVIEQAIEKLKRTNFQIIITDPAVTSIQDFLINEDEMAIAGEYNSPIATVTKDTVSGPKTMPQSSNNQEGSGQSGFAMKMMKKMGWTGAGLGVQEQGITKPIEADVIVGRSGLGFDGVDSSGNAQQDFEQFIRRYLKNYLSSNSMNKLIFSNEFSTDERKTIHAIARALGLFTKSTGKDDNRRLTVRRAAPQCRPLIEWVNQLRQTPESHPIWKKLRLVDPSSG